MRIVKIILLVLLSVLTGCLFLYSAYTKVLPIQTFEYTLVEFVHMPWWMAATFSRLLVGLEAAIGALMVLNIFGRRKWVLQLSMLILIVFSVYLGYLWVAVGNDVNCGCFGDQVWMSPSSSLLKNFGLILVTWILLKYHNGINKKWANISAIVAFIIVSAVPFFIYPIPSTQPAFLNEDKYEIDLSALYENEERDPPEVELRKGKHVLAFMSLTCPHCRMAAYKMQLMQKDNPDISMYMVLNGDSTNLEPFWEKTQARDIPHSMLLGRDFVMLSGLNLPAIYWIEDGVVIVKTDYIHMSQEGIEEWMFKK